MSVVFSDNFNSHPPYSLGGSWVATQAWTVPGGCGTGSLMACCNGTPYHPIVTGGTISVRAQVSILYGPTKNTGAELLWIHFPGINAGCGFIFGIETRPDGSFGMHMNTAGSSVFSSPGLFPTNGVMFALQWRVAVLTPYTASFAYDVNNVTVWSGVFDWSVFAIAPCTGGGGNSFFRVQLFPRTTPVDGEVYQAAFDNLEIDDSNAKVNWPVCPDIVSSGCGIPVILPPELSGIYMITESDKTHDIYNTMEKKIPDPTVKTAILGE